MSQINQLLMEMTNYYKKDPARIQHFLKVYQFSRWIGQEEHLDDKTQRILEIAAIVHDIGILPAEQKYGRCDGSLQEKEGPAVAREMLQNLGFEQELIQRVCYLIGHHHTYNNIDGLDYQILVEADFLVNLYEDHCSEQAIFSAYSKIFRTKTGKQLCSTMFDVRS